MWRMKIDIICKTEHVCVPRKSAWPLERLWPVLIPNFSPNSIVGVCTETRPDRYAERRTINIFWPQKYELYAAVREGLIASRVGFLSLTTYANYFRQSVQICLMTGIGKCHSHLGWGWWGRWEGVWGAVGKCTYDRFTKNHSDFGVDSQLWR